MAVFDPPPYPPPPPDGALPPPRDALEMCQEAALLLHIGEIVYTAKSSSREEGLAWTREAVDMAEEQMRSLGVAGSNPADRAARAACRDCLGTGIDNWTTMVSRLARDEKAKRDAAAATTATNGGGSWFALWGDGRQNGQNSRRWAAEEKVIEDRTRRVRELLEDLEPPLFES